MSRLLLTQVKISILFNKVSVHKEIPVSFRSPIVQIMLYLHQIFLVQIYVSTLMKYTTYFIVSKISSRSCNSPEALSVKC